MTVVVDCTMTAAMIDILTTGVAAALTAAMTA